MSAGASKFGRWGWLLSKFLLGQGATQLIQLVTGFLLIRWLDKGDYATYTLVMAILGTSSILFGLGLSQCLTGLIGKRVDDPEFVGRYIRASRSLRLSLLGLGAIILFAVFYWISGKFEWGGLLWVGLWLFVICSMYLKIWEQTYSPVLLLHQQIGRVYLLGTLSGLGRLLLVLASAAISLLSAPLVLLFNVLQAASNSIGTFWMARSSVALPGRGESCASERREILKLSLPKLPSFCFSAFSGQLIIFIVGVLGTRGDVAEIGALTRLAMLFVVFKRFGAVIVMPYFAKLDFVNVPARLGLLVMAMLALLFSVSGIVYLYPAPLLFLLGEGYQHLGFEVFLMITLALVRVCNVQIVSVCDARKYVFAWHSIAVVGPQLIAIVAGALIWDLGVLTNVLYFALLLALTRISSNSGILLTGLSKERRTSR